PDADRLPGRRAGQAPGRRQGQGPAAGGPLRVLVIAGPGGGAGSGEPSGTPTPPDRSEVPVTDVIWTQPGDHGAAVADLQRRLVALGHAVPPAERDGRFGGGTELAVRAFQAARHVRVDGICGPETWAALVESGFTLGDR